jgi:hypothetical protein
MGGQTLFAPCPGVSTIEDTRNFQRDLGCAPFEDSVMDVECVSFG